MFLYGMDIMDFFENKRIRYGCYGKLSEIDFLKRIYDLNSLPSYDNRFDDAEGDIWQHTINNDDYEDGWIFEDDRFELLNGDDEVLLKFLCAVFHPAVRVENGYWKEFLDAVNGLLRNDGYELYPESKISGRNVYGWRKYDPEASSLFVPFSQRNEKEIKGKTLKLSLNMKTRNQIYQLIEKYSTVYRETDETGWQYDITTSECVFRDISQFYKPKCFDVDGNYVEATNMEQFILHNLNLRCYVVIELKTGEFKPEYAGQLNFYLSAVDGILKKDNDNPSIGLLLCKSKNNLVAEYALKDMSKPIGVSEYKVTNSLPEDLSKQLPSVEDIQKRISKSGVQ